MISVYVKRLGCWQDLRAHWGSMASPPPQPQPPLTSTHPPPLGAPPSQSGKTCPWLTVSLSAHVHVTHLMRSCIHVVPSSTIQAAVLHACLLCTSTCYCASCSCEQHGACSGVDLLRPYDLSGSPTLVYVRLCWACLELQLCLSGVSLP